VLAADFVTVRDFARDAGLSGVARTRSNTFGIAGFPAQPCAWARSQVPWVAGVHHQAL